MNAIIIIRYMKRLLLIIPVLIICQLTYSQDDDDFGNEYYKEESEEKERNERIFFGGNFGTAYSSVQTYIVISPIVGMHMNEKLSVGTGPIYQYYNHKKYKVKLNIFGGKLFCRYIILNNVFAHVEDQLTFNKYNYTYNQNSDNGEYIPVNDFLVGGGLRMQIKGKSSLNITVLYNLNESDYSLNRNPVVRFDLYF